MSQTPAADLLVNAMPCPFCGVTQLRVAWWCDGDGSGLEE